MVIRMTGEKQIGKSTQSIIKHVGLACIMFFSAGLISLFGMQGIQQSSASSQYGILGRQAPGIELDSWIDGNGKPMGSLKLSDYRGKVIYLYFFQDW